MWKTIGEFYKHRVEVHNIYKRGVSVAKDKKQADAQHEMSAHACGFSSIVEGGDKS